MKTFLAIVGAAVLIIAFLTYLMVEFPSAPAGTSKTTTQLTAEGFALVRQVTAHINGLEEENRKLRAENAELRGSVAEDVVLISQASAAIQKLNAFVVRQTYRLRLLEAFLNNNGVPTPTDDATFESLKLEAN